MKLGSKQTSVYLAIAILFTLIPFNAHAESAKTTVNLREFTRWDYYSYRYSGEKLNRLVLPGENFKGCKPCKWTHADGRKARSFDPIRVKAFEEIKKFGQKSSASLPTIEWNFTPSVQPDLTKAMKRLNEQAMRYWKDTINSETPYKVVVGTDKSGSSLEKYLNETTKGGEQISAFNSFFDRYKSLAKWEKARPLGGGQASIDTFVSNGNKVFLVTYHVASFTGEKTFFFTTPAHEVTHIFQSVLSNEVGYKNGMPISLWEGSAVLFGAGIAMTNVGWYSDELDHVLMRLLSGSDSKVQMRTEADAIKLLIEAENPLTGLGTSAGYNVGPLLFEWLIAKYGVEKFIALVSATGTAKSFDEALQQSIGITKEDFYSAAAPYVLKSYQRVQKVFRG